MPFRHFKKEDLENFTEQNPVPHPSKAERSEKSEHFERLRQSFCTRQEDNLPSSSRAEKRQSLDTFEPESESLRRRSACKMVLPKANVPRSSGRLGSAASFKQRTSASSPKTYSSHYMPRMGFRKTELKSSYKKMLTPSMEKILQAMDDIESGSETENDSENEGQHKHEETTPEGSEVDEPSSVSADESEKDSIYDFINKKLSMQSFLRSVSQQENQGPCSLQDVISFNELFDELGVRFHFKVTEGQWNVDVVQDDESDGANVFTAQPRHNRK